MTEILLEAAVTKNETPGGKGQNKDHQTSLKRYKQGPLAKEGCRC